MVWVLGATETVSYGVLFYSFAVFITPMQDALGWSQATLTGAFSVSVLVTGVAAIPAGAWLDRHGARALMTAGSVLAGACVAAWAATGNVLAFYAAFTGIGVAGAAVLYEPAFATVNAWFEIRRQDALLTVTMMAGLASTIFLPAAALLTGLVGWRRALLILAGVQVATAVPHALVLRRRPADHGWQRDGTRTAAGGALAAAGPGRGQPAAAVRRQAVRAMLERPVVLLTVGSALGSGAIATVAVLLPAYLRLDGWGAIAAAASTGALGAVQVGGRVVLTRATRRLRTAVAAALMLAAQAGGIAALLLIGGPAGMVIFVILFGLGYGVLNIARPDLLARYAPRPLFARLSGMQAMLVTGAEAAGPFAGAVLRAVTGSYVPVFVAVAASSVTAALLLVAGERACCPDGITVPRWPRRREPAL